ncbi:autophagy-related 18d-like [Olea europaea subsp. europaea]|uniref:Autophagy-related 18d-like n=1 Tax=Olea europaea subsp. europaea TaxID=158383 RepID=A0A8S0QYM1_OLEEU|nr:autophagy-related 18d-like [Olea europaea subsp. europaea]
MGDVGTLFNLNADDYSFQSSPVTSAVSTCRGVLLPAAFGVDESSVGLQPLLSIQKQGSLIMKKQLHSVSWNQEYSCFAAGTSHGFRIYNCEYFEENFRQDLKSKGFKIVEMLFRCNILAFVGSKTNSHYPSNKVIIWDDHQSRCIDGFSFISETLQTPGDFVASINAHDSQIASTTLTMYGPFLATASIRGTCFISLTSPFKFVSRHIESI